MAAERLNRAIFVETNKDQTEVYNTFSQCGKIVSCYANEYQPANAPSSYFVEFADQSSVKRARTLQVSNLQVHVVAFSPLLIASFNAVTGTAHTSSLVNKKQLSRSPAGLLRRTRKSESSPTTEQSMPLSGSDRGNGQEQQSTRKDGPMFLSTLNPKSAQDKPEHELETNTHPANNLVDTLTKARRRAGKKITTKRVQERNGRHSFLSQSSSIASTNSLGTPSPAKLGPIGCASGLANGPSGDSDKENLHVSAPAPVTPSMSVSLEKSQVEELSAIIERLKHGMLPSPCQTPEQVASTSVPLATPQSQTPSHTASTPAPVLVTTPLSVPAAPPPSYSSHAFAQPEPIALQQTSVPMLMPSDKSASPSIIVTHRGERRTCDLESLETDPSGIITILREAAGQPLERDKWMIVAGHYRSKGNVAAAAEVVETMIEVMTAPPVSLTGNELRPAFLMLSSCHRDLAQQARSANGAPTDKSREHNRMATECLQRIYGTNLPPVASQVVSESAQENARKSMQISDSSKDNRLPRARQGQGCTEPGEKPSPASQRSFTVRIHERQISGHSTYFQSADHKSPYLRHQSPDTSSVVSQLRSSKRGLEDELSEERQKRRRLERDLVEAERELVCVRRGEAFALDQCRVEIESRRRAEERAEELRDEVARVRKEMEGRVEEIRGGEKKARECFGKLGALFLKAANGGESSTSFLDAALDARSSSLGISTTRDDVR